MPFNQNGQFERQYSWQVDRDNDIKIRADRVDQDMNDIAQGLTAVYGAQNALSSQVSGISSAQTDLSDEISSINSDLEARIDDVSSRLQTGTVNNAKKLGGEPASAYALADHTHQGDLTAPIDLGAGADLNTITASGVYTQKLNADAASGSNYPANVAGALMVVQVSAGISTQQYITYSYDGGRTRTFIRSFYRDVWSDWQQVATDDQIRNSSGGLRSITEHGYIDLGPRTTSFAHIYTDRPSFYFNKQLQVQGGHVTHSKLDDDDIGAIGGFWCGDPVEVGDTISGSMLRRYPIRSSGYVVPTGTWRYLGASGDHYGIYQKVAA